MKYTLVCTALTVLIACQNVCQITAQDSRFASEKSEPVSTTVSTTLNMQPSDGSILEPEPFICPGLGAYPDPLSNKTYYFCFSDGADGYIAIKLECSSGTEYIPELERCGTPGEVISTTPGTETTTLEPEPFICPGLGSYPDPLNNKSYYYCISDGEDGYIAIKLECGKDTEYIPELGACGIPGEVGSTTPNPGTEGTTVEPEPYVCPGPGLYPHPVDKRKFYLCLSDGDGGYIPIELECGGGTEFDPETEKCEKPLQSTTSVEPETTTTSSGTSTTSSPETSTSTTELPTTPGAFKCTEEGIFADPKDRTKYYYCLPDSNGGYREVLHTCSLGLVYDPEKKYCSIPDKPFITTTPSPTTTFSPPVFQCTRNGVFPDATNNRNFYMCIFDGFAYISVRMQCHQGLVFITDLYRCAQPNTQIPPPAPIKCNSVGYYPDPDSCRDYYYCYSTFDGGYMTMKKRCPPGTNFYANMEICVSEQVLKCKIEGEYKELHN